MSDVMQHGNKAIVLAMEASAFPISSCTRDVLCVPLYLTRDASLNLHKILNEMGL